MMNLERVEKEMKRKIMKMISGKTFEEKLLGTDTTKEAMTDMINILEEEFGMTLDEDTAKVILNRVLTELNEKRKKDRDDFLK
jgi:hypothetical protein